MQIINNVFFVGPHAPIVNFDSGKIELASQMALARQLEEDPNEEPLGYYEDPVIIIPTALIVKDEDGTEDMVTTDTNRPISWVVWEGGDGNYYMVQPQGCYDAQHKLQIQ